MPDPQKLLEDAVNLFRDGNDTVGIASVLWFEDTAYYYNTGLNSRGGFSVSENSVFQLQSVQKVFTGLLFAGQVVQKRMQLKCVPFLKYIPDTTRPLGPQWILQVQPWELATHTANFPDIINGNPAQNLYAGKAPPPELVDWWWTKFAPTNNTILGCEWSYSDLGVLSLGYATAGASGQTYPELLESFIKKPWEMPGTWLNMDDVPESLRVTGYIHRDWQTSILGVKSCTADMLSFVKHHLKLVAMGRVHEAAVDLVLNPLYWRHGQPTMGICWQISPHRANPELTLYAKDGGGLGFSTWVGLIPGKKCGVVFLANSQSQRTNNWLIQGRALFSGLFGTAIGEEAEALCEPERQEAGAQV
jgi:CubicO group peptidase (beta-lactamase class C family)